MKLFEFEAKRILKQLGIPIPQGNIASNPEDVKRIASEIGKPVAIKSQVLVGGRGKAGGIVFANNLKEAELVSKKLLGSKIRGTEVKQVLVEEKIEIEKEFYLGVTIDRSIKTPVVIASSEGGVDIEETSKKFADKIHRRHVDPVKGFQDYQARSLIKKIGLDGKKLLTVAGIFTKVYSVFKNYDAELTEINPLAMTKDGSFIAVDARLNIDNSSLFRHSEFIERSLLELSPLELEANKTGLAYVELEGNIGIIGNGAGLVMATLDTVKLFGGTPANFCDIGGGAQADTVVKAINLVLMKPSVTSLFINILGGITRCDEIAKGLAEVKQKGDVKVPIVVRMIGTNEEEGRRICERAGIHVLDSMDSAAEIAVKLARGR